MGQFPIIFLAGPPGVGKTTLGSRVCRELDLRFFDLSGSQKVAPAQAIKEEQKALEKAIPDRLADVITLPWSLQQDNAVLRLARRSGVLVGLWAHPLDMQERSGLRESLFTPSKRVKTRGGFGRTGMACREYRRLDRSCEEMLLLVGLSLEKGARELKDLIAAIQEEWHLPPAEREGLKRWIENWVSDCDADRRACEICVDAIARYGLHLKSIGASPRKLSAVYEDLYAAAYLIMAYDGPRSNRVLRCFYEDIWTIEYRRRFSDNPHALARYRSTLKGFERFLYNSGMIC